MASKAIPRNQIRWIVDRFHVGAADETIAQDLRKRLRRNPWIATSAGQRFETRCVKFALACHERNRELFRRVTAGRFK